MDELTGREVACKLHPRASASPRLRAEVAALRLLRLPGVARLLDEGREGEMAFLVMDLVEGRPFPGAAADRADPHGRVPWSALESTVVSLLEILARVHERGVVHRDLKPENVLCREDGRPVVLDFGLSSGSALGTGDESEAGAVGTPAFAAPEQILGESVDARADLFSLGVMLFEALAGRPPHEGATVDEFLEARLGDATPSVADFTSDVPPVVARFVDALLSREASARPRTAGHALRRLRGELPRPFESDIPRVGRQAEVQRALEALEAGRDVRVVGVNESGRSSFLQWLDDELGSRGIPTRRLAARAGPLASLEVADPTANSSLSLEEALERAVVSVRVELGRGVHLLVDDFERFDRWSRRVLDRIATEARSGHGGALVVVGPPKANATTVQLGALCEDELANLFEGPDRLFHLREDGARELVRRTGGWPARVTDELAAWQRAGLVRRTESGFAIGRRELARLANGFRVSAAERSRALAERPVDRHLEEHLAWVLLGGAHARLSVMAAVRKLPRWRVEAERLELLEAGALRLTLDGRVEATTSSHALEEWSDQQRRAVHSSLAESLAPGSDGRLLHLLSAARLEEVPVEACALAERLRDEGRLAEAEAALTEGLIAVRSEADPTAELALLANWMTVALSAFVPQAIDRVMYELARADDARELAPDSVDALEAFGRAALAIVGGTDERALDRIRRVPVFPDVELERWRLALSVQAARAASREREREVLEAIADDYAEHPSKLLRASVAEWFGRLAYREDRLTDAVAHYARAIELAERPTQRLSAILNAASAHLEASEFERATELADEAREEAAAIRHTLFEVRAEWILRSAAYRSGVAQHVDLELVRAARSLGVRSQEALICLNEAAVAWRLQDGHAPLLAHRAAELWGAQGNVGGTLLARALELAASRPARVDAGLAEELVRTAREFEEPLIAAQALALLRLSGVPLGDAERRRVRSALSRDFSGARDARREILSLSELEPATA